MRSTTQATGTSHASHARRRSACAVFDSYWMKYGFIFELHPKSTLHWCQLPESVTWPLLGLQLLMAVDFATLVGAVDFYRYWLVVLLTGNIVVMSIPAPILYHKARKRMFFTLGRELVVLLFVHIEFRDSPGGDILCSLTCSFDNLFLSPCVYDQWDRPSPCPSQITSTLSSTRT